MKVHRPTLRPTRLLCIFTAAMMCGIFQLRDGGGMTLDPAATTASTDDKSVVVEESAGVATFSNFWEDDFRPALRREMSVKVLANFLPNLMSSPQPPHLNCPSKYITS